MPRAPSIHPFAGRLMPLSDGAISIANYDIPGLVGMLSPFRHLSVKEQMEIVRKVRSFVRLLLFSCLDCYVWSFRIISFGLSDLISKHGCARVVVTGEDAVGPT